MNVLERILRGQVFYVGVNFHSGVSHEGRDVLMESEPDFPALFEKRSETK